MRQTTGDLPLPEDLYPEVVSGSVLRVWCLGFPPERIGDRLKFHLLEFVDVLFPEVPSAEHDPVRGYDNRGRVFLTSFETRHPQPNRVLPSFFVPDSIESGGGSPEWVTPELAAHNQYIVVS